MKVFNFYRQDERGYDVGVSPEEKAKTVQDHIEKYLCVVLVYIPFFSEWYYAFEATEEASKVIRTKSSKPQKRLRKSSAQSLRSHRRGFESHPHKAFEATEEASKVIRTKPSKPQKRLRKSSAQSLRSHRRGFESHPHKAFEATEEASKVIRTKF